jgi:hypothetical protein
MKRDLLLCADILRAVENEDSEGPIESDPLLKGCDPDTLAYHMRLLKDGGFIRATPRDDGLSDIDLTMAGYDFLAIANHPAFREYYDKVAAVNSGGVPYAMVKAHIEGLMLKEILAALAFDAVVAGGE